MKLMVKSSDRRLVAGLITACAALCGSAGAAAGQSAARQERVVVVTPTPPPAPQAARSGGGRGWVAEGQPSRTRIVEIHKIEDGRSFVLRLEGDALSVKVDGQTVPEERLERLEGSVRVIGEDGSEVTSFELPEGAHVSVFGENGTFSFVTAEGNRIGFRAAEQPRVMVGITMADVTEPLREHLGLKEGEATMVDVVIEGLPAHRAGLRRGDVIVAIDGKTPATPEKLREALRDKEPGDTLELRIVQKGQEKTVRLELDKYKAEDLNISMPSAFAGVLAGEQMQRALEEQVRALEMERRELRSRGLGGAHREVEALRLREEALRKLMERGAGGAPAAPTPPAAPEAPMIFTPGEFGGWGTLRPVPGDMQKRMQELDERLAGLDERLTDLDEKLSRIERALGRLGEGGSR